MRYIWQHIDTIISNYNGGIPLAHFLKNYFKLNPKLGSRDRKILSEMAYCYYRCNKGLDAAAPLEVSIPASLQLCNSSQKFILPFLPAADTPLPFHIDRLFPYNIALSAGIGTAEWLGSILVQPRMFIRVRKNKPAILKLLRENDIDFEEISSTCLSLPNASAVDKLLPPDSYVVQDASSQQTGGYFNPIDGQQWWDCCAGAGGKSLLLKDQGTNIDLVVTDKRESILHNLLERFKLYHHAHPASFTINLAIQADVHSKLSNRRFDRIICDAPCTGSGTWARTPEQLYFFEPKQLEDITALQEKIVQNVVAYLKPGGRLFYITCSVFEAENEGIVRKLLLADDTLQLQEMTLINGVAMKADSMFIAVLEKKG